MLHSTEVFPSYFRYIKNIFATLNFYQTEICRIRNQSFEQWTCCVAKCIIVLKFFSNLTKLLFILQIDLFFSTFSVWDMQKIVCQKSFLNWECTSSNVPYWNLLQLKYNLRIKADTERRNFFSTKECRFRPPLTAPSDENFARLKTITLPLYHPSTFQRARTIDSRSDTFLALFCR